MRARESLYMCAPVSKYVSPLKHTCHLCLQLLRTFNPVFSQTAVFKKVILVLGDFKYGCLFFSLGQTDGDERCGWTHLMPFMDLQAGRMKLKRSRDLHPSVLTCLWRVCLFWGMGGLWLVTYEIWCHQRDPKTYLGASLHYLRKYHLTSENRWCSSIFWTDLNFNFVCDII